MLWKTLVSSTHGNGRNEDSSNLLRSDAPLPSCGDSTSPHNIVTAAGKSPCRRLRRPDAAAPDRADFTARALLIVLSLQQARMQVTTSWSRSWSIAVKPSIAEASTMSSIGSSALARIAPSSHIVRLTGDCPLADPDVIDAVIAHHLVSRGDITTNSVEATFPDGLDVEVLQAHALPEAAAEAASPTEREHVTQFLYRRPDRYRIVHYKSATDLSGLRWTVDEPADLEFVRRVYADLYNSNPCFGMHDVLALMKQHPNLGKHNGIFERNEGLTRSLTKEGGSRFSGDKVMAKRYAKSEVLFERARRTIPLAAQTFSKSTIQLPLGAAPLFAKRAKGSKLWDVDGNEYIDFVNGLAAITLGYVDPDVTTAVMRELECGTLYSLSHEIEARVAEKIVRLVPSAEMVRFGKNGSDATAGAIRVARAATGREDVLVAGYHGWQDWYIGSTTRDKGVPNSVKALTHRFIYNDVNALEARLQELNGKVAAIILEPMNVEYPKPGYLEAVRKLATSAGAVLIFDEMITGFRYAKGGAQDEFGGDT